MTIHAFQSRAYVIPYPTPVIYASLDPAVPEGKLLIVEHISGWVAVKDGYVLDKIEASGTYWEVGHEVFLPVHFASQPLNFGMHGVARMYQFGSPCRLYVSAGERVNVHAAAEWLGE